MGIASTKPVIIVSRTDRLGDILLCFPAFYLLRARFPNAEIILLIKKYTKDLLYNQKVIDRIVCIDDYKQKELKNIIRQCKADVFIALMTNSQTGKLALASKAEIRIGPLSKFHSWFVYKNGLIQKRSLARRNEAVYNLDLVSLIPGNLSKSSWLKNTLWRKQNAKITLDSNGVKAIKLYYQQEHINYAKSFLRENEIREHSFILIYPFSGCSAKNLSLEQYLQLAIILQESIKDIKIIFCSSYLDNYQQLRAMLPKSFALFINDGSILNLVALIDRCSLFIGSSTGPTHIAGILGKKVVAIYPHIRNQSPQRWGIIGSRKVRYIQPYAPCFQKYGCKKNCKYYNCFDNIDIAKAADNCISLLVEADEEDGLHSEFYIPGYSDE